MSLSDPPDTKCDEGFTAELEEFLDGNESVVGGSRERESGAVKEVSPRPSTSGNVHGLTITENVPFSTVVNIVRYETKPRGVSPVENGSLVEDSSNMCKSVREESGATEKDSNRGDKMDDSSRSKARENIPDMTRETYMDVEDRPRMDDNSKNESGVGFDKDSRKEASCSKTEKSFFRGMKDRRSEEETMKSSKDGCSLMAAPACVPPSWK